MAPRELSDYADLDDGGLDLQQVMSCSVIQCHAMPCHVSCNAMSCHVMSHQVSFIVQCNDGMSGYADLDDGGLASRGFPHARPTRCFIVGQPVPNDSCAVWAPAHV